jgi:hypothetical protein
VTLELANMVAGTVGGNSVQGFDEAAPEIARRRMPVTPYAA